MNNKLYKKYLSLKIDDTSYFYLFKTNDIYVFIADDAQILAPLLRLDLINLNTVIMKCEFSSEQSEYYLKKLNDLKIKFKIITLSDDIFNYNLEECFQSNKYNELINHFLAVNIDNLSISQAYDLLKNLQDKFKTFKP